MKPTGLAIVVILVLILPYSWAESIPRTYYVSPTGSATYPFSTPETAATVIQHAVDAAQYGDVVQLMPGEYRQRAKLKDGARLWGSGRDSTTIVALEEGRYGAALTGADGAEVRAIRFVREESDLPTFPVAVNLGRYGDQVVADCGISGAFQTGISAVGPPQGGPALIYGCTFEGAWDGVFLGDYGPRAAVDSCTFLGDYYAGAASGFLLLTRCTFTAGFTQFYIGEADVLMDSCLFSDPSGYGAYVTLDGNGSLRMANCIMWGMAAGLIVNIADNVDIYNSTFVNELGGVIFCDPSVKIVLRNTILWGPPSQLNGVNPASFDVQYCDVAGGWEGEGNIDADPRFADFPNGGFRLRPDSPCIDAGINSPDLPEFDIAGMHRIMFGGKSLTVDMGAYEFYINKLEPVIGTNEAIFTWSSLEDRTYSVFYTDDLFTWHTAIAAFPSSGNQTTSWLDDGSLTGVPPLLAPKRFYRLLENP